MYYFVILSILFLIIFCKLTLGRCNSKTCLVGKTAIVTGGNSGIGYQIALGLASRGCKVIIVDKDDCTQSRQNIIEETDNKNIVMRTVDFGSLSSVRKLVDFIKQTEPKLDILINNAGIGSTTSVLTEDGIQRIMQVNYFGHFLLTYLLIDLLKKSAPSRIIFTSSIVAFTSKVDIDNLNPPANYFAPQRMYGDSKLCMILAARYLAEKLKTSNVTINCQHPGAVRSGIFITAFKENWTIIPLFLGSFTLLFGKSTEEGAQTALYLACEKKLSKVSGKFFLDCMQVVMPYQAYNKELCRELFERSKKIVKLNPEEQTI